MEAYRGCYLHYVGKAKRWREKPLDEEVFAALANDSDKEGYVFPWRTRSGVHKWLRPLTRKLKVTFTPHMARHFVGKRFGYATAPRCNADWSPMTELRLIPCQSATATATIETNTRLAFAPVTIKMRYYPEAERARFGRPDFERCDDVQSMGCPGVI